MTRLASPGTGRRYLSLVLPHLSTDLLERRMSPEARAEPRVTVAAEKGALRLFALNPAAAALGLAPGMALTDARARHPALLVAEAEPQRMRAMLEQMADACERYTPLLALDGPDGLLLDVTGCAHLFGGEAALVRDLLRRVGRSGFAGRAALAATAGAAFALARFAAGAGRSRGVVVPAEEDLAALLAPLPVAALRLADGMVDGLARLGLRRVGDLLGKPRAPLAARFGADLLQRLDRALGLAPAALDYRFPPPVFCAERNLFEPVEQVEDVLGLARSLAAALVAPLERGGAGARRLELALFRVDGQVTRLCVGTSRPLRDPEVVRRLFAEKVAAITSLDAGFGFDLLRLVVREAAPFTARQEGFGDDARGDAALEGLVDRLSIRFGAQQVQRLVLADHHVPEEAGRLVPARGMGNWAVADEADLVGDDGFGGVAPGRSGLFPAESPATSALPGPAVFPAPGAAVPAPPDIAAFPPADVAASSLLGVAAFPPPQPSTPGGRGGGAAGISATSTAGQPLAPAAPVEALSCLRGRAGRGPAAFPAPGAAVPAPPDIAAFPPADVAAFPPPQPSPASGRGGIAAGISATFMAGQPRPPEALSRLRGRVGRGLAGEVRGPAGAAVADAGHAAGQPAVSPSRRRRGSPGLAPSALPRPDLLLPDLCGPARPLRLLDRPEPVEAVAEVPDGPPIRFRWRRRLHHVARAEGPERIAVPWWREAGEGLTRDYFRVETREGRRYWLFRAGLYGAGDHPAWFLHGLFG